MMPSPTARLHDIGQLVQRVVPRLSLSTLPTIADGLRPSLPISTMAGLQCADIDPVFCIQPDQPQRSIAQALTITLLDAPIGLSRSIDTSTSARVGPSHTHPTCLTFRATVSATITMEPPLTNSPLASSGKPTIAHAVRLLAARRNQPVDHPANIRVHRRSQASRPASPSPCRCPLPSPEARVWTPSRREDLLRNSAYIASGRHFVLRQQYVEPVLVSTGIGCHRARRGSSPANPACRPSCGSAHAARHVPIPGFQGFLGAEQCHHSDLVNVTPTFFLFSRRIHRNPYDIPRTSRASSNPTAS